MKYELSFYRKVSVFTVFLLLSLSSNIFSTTCVDFSNGSRLLAMLHSMAPAHQIIKDGENRVITEDGSYHILENITGSITVGTAADKNVVIDLNGFTISGTAAALITVAQNVENVVIKNGAICGDCTNVGIKLMAGAKRITLENLRISNVNKGIHFAGTTGGNTVECCRVTNVHISHATMGVDLDYTEKSLFKDVEVCCATYFGFDLHVSKYNKFEQCKAIGIVNSDGDKMAAGFRALAGLDNLFFECFSERIAKCDSKFCTKAAGFFFGFAFDPMKTATVAETESKIINCCVDTIKTTSFGNAFGICLEMRLRDLATTVTLGDFDTVINDIAWSPQGNLLGAAGSDKTYGIIDFDGTSLNTVLTSDDLFQAANGVAWSADGRYLASVITFSNAAPEVIVQDSKHDLRTYSFDYIASNTAFDVKWFNKCTKFVVSGDPFLDVFYFDGKMIHLVNTAEQEQIEGRVAISPDDCHIAVGDVDGDIEIYNPDDLKLSDFITFTAGTAVRDLDWNPVACCSSYYLAVVGDTGNVQNDLNIEIFEFDDVSLTRLAKAKADADLTSIRWSPRGKEFVVTGTNQTVTVYSFDPQSPNVITEKFTYQTVVGLNKLGSSKHVDWSPCGRFIVIAGDDSGLDNPVTEADQNIEIIRVGDSVEKCVVENNKIANVCGGICGIGIFGGGFCNLIDKNVVCCSGVPYSWGVYGKYLGGLLGFAGALDNLYGNDCCVCCECGCRAPVCDCDCVNEL